LRSIIEAVHALIIPHLTNSKVIWRSLPGLKECKVFGAKDQLIEVFLNLCTNAVDSMQPDGGELSVDMDFNTSKRKVGVIFKDTGPGISPEILPHIFEPFMTTKEYGLGLGLSICYGIIQKHGGQITVDSLPCQGTSFTVWLPIVQGTEETGD
jgi:two-component system NtrC family sensor kinase